MSAVSFGGQPCLDPLLLHRQCVERGLPTDWFGQANAFRAPVNGVGSGAVLLRKTVLDALRASSLTTQQPTITTLPTFFDFKFTDEAGRTATVKNVVMQDARCLTPGAEADDAAYLVQLTDYRGWILASRNKRVLHSFSAGAGFNLRYDDGVPLPESWASSSTYANPIAISWATAVSVAWVDVFGNSSIPGATTPTLPFTPHGFPNHLDYSTIGYVDTLNHILIRLACVWYWNPCLNTYGIARIGATDTAALQTLAKLREYLLWSDYQTKPARSWEYISVYFRSYPFHYSGPVWMGDLNHNTNSLLSSANLWGERLFDDAACTASDISADTYMIARGNERRSDFLRVAALVPAIQVYAGAHQSLASCLGAQWSEVAYYDVGDGVKSEIARRSFEQDLLDWKPLYRPTGPVSAWRTGGTEQTGAPSATALAAGAQRVAGILALPPASGGTHYNNSTGFAAAYYRIRAYFKGTVGAGGGAPATLTFELCRVNAAGAVQSVRYSTSVTVAASASGSIRDSCEIYATPGYGEYYAIIATLTGAGASGDWYDAPYTVIHAEPIYPRGMGEVPTPLSVTPSSWTLSVARGAVDSTTVLTAAGGTGPYTFASVTSNNLTATVVDNVTSPTDTLEVKGVDPPNSKTATITTTVTDSLGAYVTSTGTVTVT